MNVDITDTENFWFQKPHLQIHTSELLLLLSKTIFFAAFPIPCMDVSVQY